MMASVNIRNRCFNSRLGKAPYEALIGKQQNLSNIHVFGSTSYAFIQNAKKLDACCQKGIFIGYDNGSPAYLVFYPETNKAEKVRRVKFIDNFQAVRNDHHDVILDSGQGESADKLQIPSIVDEQQNIPEVEADVRGQTWPINMNSTSKTLMKKGTPQEHEINQIILDRVNLMITQVTCWTIAIGLQTFQLITGKQ